MSAVGRLVLAKRKPKSQRHYKSQNRSYLTAYAT